MPKLKSKFILFYLFTVERQKALLAEKQRKEAEMQAELTRQQMRNNEVAWGQSIQQLKANNIERNKQMREQFDQTLKAKINEQRRLLKEGFAKEAAQLRREIENLRSRRH